MAKPMTPDQILAAMKKWHVPYHEYPGWKTRGRPASTGPFSDVRGIMIHHTGSDAGQSDDYLKFLFVDGRADLPAPLCNTATDMDGDLHLGAIGRANHAGRGSSTVLAKVTTENHPGYTSELHPGADSADGNAHFYGNEVRYDGGQPMTPKQYATAVRWAAAVCDFHHWTALAIIGHREWTTRKVDPGHCPMNKFRADVAALLKAGSPTPTPPVTGGLSMADAASIEAQITALDNKLLGRYRRDEETRALTLNAIAAIASQIKTEDAADDAALAKAVADLKAAIEAPAPKL
jgi:hypothetical protein